MRADRNNRQETMCPRKTKWTHSLLATPITASRAGFLRRTSDAYFLRHTDAAQCALPHHRAARDSAEPKDLQRRGDRVRQPSLSTDGALSTHRGVGGRKARDYGLAKQSSGVRLDHYCCHLSRALANRSVLPPPEAESADQNVCRNQRQCAVHSNLDSTDCVAGTEIYATAVQFRLVTV